jgi:aryl-alcohol dehydrogenase-like predicted oxidoreductase
VLGRSGLEITTMGVGAWAMGGGGWSGGYGRQDDRESIAAIHRALELGVNWIDTAAIYGLGHSEQVVGRAIAGLAERPLVFTKCSLVRDARGEVVTDLTAATIRAECEQSLRRLGVDVIDLYQIHWPEPEIGGSLEEAWGTLAELQREGKVMHLGGSNFETAHIDRVTPIAPIVSLQPSYSLLERGAEADLLPRCLADGIGVIVYSPMASGLLTGTWTRERSAALPEDDWRRADPKFSGEGLEHALTVADGLGAVAARLNSSAGQAAVAWTLANRAVTGAIVGVRTPAQVEELVFAGDLDLDPATVTELNELV